MVAWLQWAIAEMIIRWSCFNNLSTSSCRSKGIRYAHLYKSPSQPAKTVSYNIQTEGFRKMKAAGAGPGAGAGEAAGTSTGVRGLAIAAERKRPREFE